MSPLLSQLNFSFSRCSSTDTPRIRTDTSLIHSNTVSEISPLLLHLISLFDFSLCFRPQDGSSASPELTKTTEKERTSPVKGVLVCDTLRVTVVIDVIHHINHTCAVILICPTGIMFVVRESAVHPQGRAVASY